MKQTPLKPMSDRRREELRAAGQVAVWSTFAAQSPRKPTVPAKLRESLAARSGGWCEARLTGCTGRAIDVAHRIARQAGGRPLGDDARLSNVTHQCRACHRWCTDNPAVAYALGLALRDWQKPEEERVSYRGEFWVVLGDDGSVVGFP